MKIEKIKKREKKPLFRLFLKRIGFKNFDEYYELFGDDISKREECVKRFLKTYSNLFPNQGR